MSDYFYLNILSLEEVIARIGLAALFGLLLGLDRDWKNKPVDFRAYMIVALTSCLVAILSLELSVEIEGHSEGALLDLSKVIAGVLTGIGFLGAGAIIKRQDQVIGTATGASIWASGGMGLTLGFGYYALACVAFVAVLAILVIGGTFRTIIGDKEDKEDDYSQ